MSEHKIEYWIALSTLGGQTNDGDQRPAKMVERSLVVKHRLAPVRFAPGCGSYGGDTAAGATRPDGTEVDKSDMPWDSYKNMKEEDVRAIYRYLRTIKPINNKVPENIPP